MNYLHPIPVLSAFCAGAAVLLTCSASRAGIIYAETFDGVALGPNKEEGIHTGSAGAFPSVWTKSPPTGWQVDDTAMTGLGNPATDGVVEWGGWSFADRLFWNRAEDQRRTEFLKGGFAVAVTDPDEWNDLPTTTLYNSFLLTPQIPLTAAGGQPLKLRFDSSWRPEANQKAVIEASWNGGAMAEILRWEGDEASPFFHSDESTNETVSLDLTAPTGATTLQLKFGTIDAGNNWWWAIDNLVIHTGTPPPVITDHPVTPDGTPFPAIVFSGGSAGFAVTVDPASEPVTYQWVKMVGGTRTVLTGKTAPGLELTNLASQDDGDYLCEVTNAGGMVRSGPARVDVQGLLITVQPEPLVRVVGEPAEFAVTAEGPGTLTYQWFKGSGAARTELAGKTAPTLTIPSPTIADAGVYSARITSSLGSVFSNEANLEVLPVRIDVQPEGQIVSEGDAAQFQVMASGPTLAYQWFHRAGTEAPVAVPGATTATLGINPTLRTSAGYYSVKVSNSFGELTSGEAKLTLLAVAGPNVIFQENWDGIPLGPNVEEDIANPVEAVWSSTLPTGWSVDNTAMPQPNPADVAGTDGVREWFGWNLTDPLWWASVAGDQNRTLFTKGTGAIAVADSDEWDDLAHTGGTYKATLISPAIPLTGVTAESVVLVFDSSWRPEGNQKARVEVSFGGATWQPVVVWDSSGPDFHPDSEDETVQVAIANPAGASSMTLRFTKSDASNNWWWAIDNLRVTASGSVAPTTPLVIRSVTRDPVTGVLTIRWSSVPQTQYTLQYSTNLTTWTNGPTATGAAGSETSITFDPATAVPPSPATLYLRIRQ